MKTILRVSDRGHIGNRWVAHAGLDWYDNSARMHDPLLARFTTMDPKHGDYTQYSPYSHCAGNPVNRVDLFGKDEIAVDSLGYFSIVRQTNDKFDTLHTENGNSLQVSKSFFKSRVYMRTKPEDTPSSTKHHLYKINDINEGRNVSNFLMSNTKVEWAFSVIGCEEYKYSYIGTSHNYGSTYIGSLMLYRFIKPLENMLLFDHSHPNNSSLPSPADIEFLNDVIKLYPNCEFGIVTPATIDRYIYNQNTVGTDLNEVSVEGVGNPKFDFYRKIIIDKIIPILP